jgi:hypothetical protein
MDGAAKAAEYRSSHFVLDGRAISIGFRHRQELRLWGEVARRGVAGAVSGST